jgi:uncharacterized protein (DUF1697 family)
VAASKSERFVLLLRGINLGPNNKLPMPDLCALVEELGARDVRHYIQSGNLAFDATTKVAAGIPTRLSTQIKARWGYDVPVVSRTRSAVVAVVDRNPFLRRGVALKSLHVAFLADPPSKSRVATLDATRSPGDEFAVVGSEIYLLLPNGVARTKLTNAYFDRSLETISTVRNWNTVQKLTEL